MWRTRAAVFGLFGAVIGLLVLILSFPMLLSDPVPGQPDDPLWFEVVFGCGIVLFVGGLLAFATGALATLILVFARAVRG